MYDYQNYLFVISSRIYDIIVERKKMNYKVHMIMNGHIH